jgi:hypothetical protein
MLRDLSPAVWVIIVVIAFLWLIGVALGLAR